MAISRSAHEYLARTGIVEASNSPGPRLDVDEVLVHRVPIPSPPLPSQDILRSYEGDPSPDRGASKPWPGQVITGS